MCKHHLTTVGIDQQVLIIGGGSFEHLLSWDLCSFNTYSSRRVKTPVLDKFLTFSHSCSHHQMRSVLVHDLDKLFILITEHTHNFARLHHELWSFVTYGISLHMCFPQLTPMNLFTLPSLNFLPVFQFSKKSRRSRAGEGRQALLREFR